MDDKYFPGQNHNTVSVFRLILAYVLFLNLPLFFFKEAIVFRGISVLLVTNIVYVFVFEKTGIQIKLLQGLRYPLLLNSFLCIEKKTRYLDGGFRLIVFLFLFSTLSLFSEKHLILLILFTATKFFWIFLVLPKLLYRALFYSSEFPLYLIDLKKKCMKNKVDLDSIARIEKSFS